MWGLQHQKDILPPLSSDWDGGSSGIKGRFWSFKTTVEPFIGAGNGEGQEYSLIISSRNGLLRYAMRDRIGHRFSSGTPIISFVGKEGRFINAVGEKVTEEQLVLAIQVGQVDWICAIIEWAEIPRFIWG